MNRQSTLYRRIDTALNYQRFENLYRSAPIIELGKNRPHSFIDFSTNDYLGLASSKQSQVDLSQAIEESQVGAGSSRLIAGNYESLLEAERAFAEYFNYPVALFFSSGYQANTALISALFQSGDQLFYDKQVHASMIKGMQLSGASMIGFQHNRFSHLEKRLAKLCESTVKAEKALLIESCYSMAGDSPDFKQLDRIQKQASLFSIVDEAHAVGLLGPKGVGLTGHQGADFRADIKVGTLGKAFGFFGAFILCSSQVKEYLINFASPLIYTTALPPFFGPYLLKLLRRIENMDAEREEVLEKADRLRSGLRERGVSCGGDYQIITIPIGDEKKVVEVARGLREQGIGVGAIRFPTVGHAQAILRLGVGVFGVKQQTTGMIADAVKGAQK